jgi:hypothetical protein
MYAVDTCHYARSGQDLDGLRDPGRRGVHIGIPLAREKGRRPGQVLDQEYPQRFGGPPMWQVPWHDMASYSNGDGSKPPKLSQRLSETFLRPAKNNRGPVEEPWGDRILPPEERKAAMDSLDAMEVKITRAGLIFATIVAPLIAFYNAVNHAHRTVIIHGHKALLPLQASWLVLGGVIVIFCLLGFVALHRRKRTLVVFNFFILGLAAIPLLAPVGFALVVLAGWLMMRAYRINKYGSPITKVVAREAAKRPPRRERRQQAAATAARPNAAKAPSANKRYTPKAAPRKKISKPTE